jgi:hypothetical protein
MQDGCERSVSCRRRVNVFSPRPDVWTCGVAKSASVMMASCPAWLAVTEKVMKRGDFVAAHRDLRGRRRRGGCGATPKLRKLRVFHCLRGSAIMGIRVTLYNKSNHLPGISTISSDRKHGTASPLIPGACAGFTNDGVREAGRCAMLQCLCFPRHRPTKGCQVSQAYTGISNIALISPCPRNPPATTPVTDTPPSRQTSRLSQPSPSRSESSNIGARTMGCMPASSAFPACLLCNHHGSR